MLIIFCLIAATVTLAERLAPARPQALFREGFIADLVHTGVNIVLRAVLTGTIAVGITEGARRVLPESMVGIVRDAPIALQLAVVVLVLDFFFYWMHRAKHHYDWWWRLHETHHSSREFDWFSSVRFHPLEKILDRMIYLLPLAVLGPSEEVLLGLAAVDATVATLAHSNLKLRIGPLIYLFVGPEMHSWHHAADARHQRTNFGNNLSIFDWLFGTASLPEGRPATFGTGDPAYPYKSWWGQLTYAFRRSDPTAS